MIYDTILYYIILYYNILYYIILYYIVLYYIALYYIIILYYCIYIILYYAILYNLILYYTIWSIWIWPTILGFRRGYSGRYFWGMDLIHWRYTHHLPPQQDPARDGKTSFLYGQFSGSTLGEWSSNIENHCNLQQLGCLVVSFTSRIF